MPNLPRLADISDQLTPIQKVGQLFMPAAFINDTESEIQKLERLIKTHHIGSLCFFHSRASAATNFEGKKVVIHNDDSYDRLIYLIERYQKAAAYPLLIAIDAEWGLAMRVENTPQYPYAITLGAMQNQSELVFEVGKYIAKDCKKAGIHWNLAPVVDINLNPENPVIGYRSFGDDKEVLTEYAEAYRQGMRSEGVLNSIKHFPGHGDTATDSHLGLPIIDKSKEVLLENELFPFVKLLDEDLDAVMVGHLAVPALANNNRVSASISQEIMTDFLRGELGWNGLIISDALNMHAISKDFTEKGTLELSAFKAGNDVLCFAEHVVEGIEHIAQEVDDLRIQLSFERLWRLKERVIDQAENINASPTKEHYEQLMAKLAKKSLTELHGDVESIKKFRELGFRTLQIGKQSGYFIESVSLGNNEKDQVLISIVPRQVKPNNNFGFSGEELDALRKTLNSGTAILYLFGNPFVLNLLPWKKALAVVVVYQDFKAFQQNAVAHFHGKSLAEGKLPVTLKNQDA